MARKKSSAAPASAAAERVVEHWTSRVLPLTAAPAACAGEAAAIAVMHHYWGGSPVATPLYTSGLSVTGIGATFYAWAASGKHRTHLRWLSSASVGAAAAAATVGTVIGLTPMGGEYALGSLALSVMWGIRHVLKMTDEGSGHPLGQLGEAIGLERHRISEIRRSGKGVVTATVQAVDGATIDEMQGSMSALQAAAGVPRGGAVLRADDDNAAVGYLEITVADLLKMTIPWPGMDPGRLGALCTEPIPLGIYENGDEFAGLPLTPEGDVEHRLVIGVTGAGKSELALLYMGTQCTRRQVSTVGIDTSKGLATFGPIAHGMTRNGLLVTDNRTAKRLIKALAGPVFKARMDYLTSQGMSKWAPVTPSGEKCAINLMEIWVEEAADHADGESYAEMCRRLRSAGMIITTSLQRAAWDDMATKARAMHGGSIAFGCRDEQDAAFALPPEVIDAGASPTWRNRKPGYHYCCALGAPYDNWTRKLRSYYVHDRARLAADITAAEHLVSPMDDITAKALGDLWTKRAVYDAPVGLPGAVPAQAPAPGITPAAAPTITAAPPAALENDDTDEDDMPDEELEDLMTEKDRAELDEAGDDILGALRNARRAEIDEAAGGSADDEYDDDDDDFDAAMPDVDDIDIDLGGGEDETDYTPADARRMLLEQLARWLDADKTSFSPRDLYPLIEKLGRTRRWFYHLRDDLVDEGVIAEGEEIGEFDIVQVPMADATTGGQ